MPSMVSVVGDRVRREIVQEHKNWQRPVQALAGQLDLSPRALSGDPVSLRDLPVGMNGTVPTSRSPSNCLVKGETDLTTGSMLTPDNNQQS
jgi:hypothetical protein